MAAGLPAAWLFGYTLGMSLLLHLIRHGQASATAADYDQLQPLGELQARLLGEHFRERGQRFDALYVGPLRRQRETLRLLREAAGDIAARWPEAIVLEELAEGPFEALMRNHVRPRLGHDPALQAIVQKLRSASDDAARDTALARLFDFMIGLWRNGELSGDDLEPAASFFARVARARERIAERERDGSEVAVVTSNGVIGQLLEHGGWAPPPGERFRVHNASISLLEIDAGKSTMRACNLTPHLPAAEQRTLL